MVNVEKIKVKGKTYYKLVHTIRKGNKITHKSRYLGKYLPSKQKLERLEKEFLRQIRTNKYKYLSSKDAEGIESKKSQYRKELKRLNPAEKEKQLKEFIIRFTYDSSKLAGVNVTLRQTFVDGNSRLSRLLMNWILWKKGYPLIDIPIEDLENYYSALDKYQMEKDEKPFVEHIKRKYLRIRGLKPSHDSGVDVCPPCAQSASGKTA